MMKNVKRKIITIVMCAMVLFVSSMLAGCSININTDTDKTSSAAAKKTPSPTVKPSQTQKPAQPTQKPTQQTGNNGKTQGNNTGTNENTTGKNQDSAGKDTSGEYDSEDKTGSEDDTVQFESQLGDEAILHSPDGEDVTVTRSDDGEFYDENGVWYPDLDKLSIFGDLVTNENGESFYWGPSWKEGDPVIPDQRAAQAMMYKADGSSVLIKLSDDGNWYDENGVSFGDVDDALTAGDPVTNENGETYYWTIPE